MYTKLKVFKSNVIAVLLYGCETWRITKNDGTKLDVFLYKNLRRLMKSYWRMKVPIEEILDGLTSVVSVSKSTGGAGGSLATFSEWMPTPRHH